MGDNVTGELEKGCAIQKPRKQDCAHSAINSILKPVGRDRTLTRRIHGVASFFAAKKLVRPPEGRCPTTKFFMVIFYSTAVPGLPLNLGVEVKKFLFIYFDRRARRSLLENSPDAPIFHFQRPLKNSH